MDTFSELVQVEPGTAVVALGPKAYLFILLKSMIQCQPHGCELQQEVHTLPMPKDGPNIEKLGANRKTWSPLQHNLHIIVLSYNFKEQKSSDNSVAPQPKTMYLFLHGKTDA